MKGSSKKHISKNECLGFKILAKRANVEPIIPGWYILAVLGLLMGFAYLSTDLYLPAMPAMGRSLHATAGMLEWTISGYLIGFSIGQLLWGPISDRFGRRPTIGCGLILFVIGSAGCALAREIATMIGWRIIQALGACASVALSRAMVRDLYQGAKAAKMLSTLIMIMAVTPLIGPLVGGQLVTQIGWRAIFWLLVAVGLLTLVALYTIPETLPLRDRNPESLGRALLSYVSLLKNRQMLGYLGCGGFLYAGMFTYIAGTPFIYIRYYHVAASHYGLLFGLGIIGIMLANMLNRSLVERFDYDRVLLLGTICALASGLWSWAAAYNEYGGLWGLVVPLVLFVSSGGLIVANSISGALSGFSQRAGAVSALTGAVQYGSGIFGSGLVGFLADGSPRPLGLIMAFCGAGCLLSILLLVKKISK